MGWDLYLVNHETKQFQEVGRRGFISDEKAVYDFIREAYCADQLLAAIDTGDIIESLCGDTYTRETAEYKAYIKEVE